MQAKKEVLLILDDGSRFRGYSFGYDKAVAGEVVFNTAMTGYPESLTDPSYSGQMMVLTYPLVGNYGVPRQTFETNGISTFLESEKIHAEAIIVSDYSENYSHWNRFCRSQSHQSSRPCKLQRSHYIRYREKTGGSRRLRRET